MSMPSASRRASDVSPASISMLTACSATLVGPNTVHRRLPSPVVSAARAAWFRRDSRAAVNVGLEIGCRAGGDVFGNFGFVGGQQHLAQVPFGSSDTHWVIGVLCCAHSPVCD